MKKIILFLVFIFSVFFIPNIAYGQDIDEKISSISAAIPANFSGAIPVLSCGVAGDTTGKDKCCYVPITMQCSNPLLDNANGVLHTFSGADSVIDNLLKGCEAVNKYGQSINNTPCIVGDPSTADLSNPSCKCISKTPLNSNQAMTDMCVKYLSLNLGEAASCVRCASGNGMWTGMGCLPLDLSALISSFILSTGIGIGGMFALLCIIYAAFMMQSSEGNPEKLKKAQEMITSCIMGLMLIIFSVFIMRIIGVNILRIPGFG